VKGRAFMKEKDKIIFYDTSNLVETEGIRSRTNAAYIEEHLYKSFPDETVHVTSVQINDTGKYTRLLFPIKGLPPFCSVKLKHSTGRHTERITVWSPLAWNDRFIGTGGGGTGTGGDNYIFRPNNTRRGQTLPNAICNGFTAATTDAGNTKREWALDKKTCEIDWERIENWRARSTHFMTLVGKAVSEILHKRPVRYSYFHGGSGGGRQAMAEVQEFPKDYNGIWASCPAINWTKFVMAGLWPIAVMNSYKHILSPKKMKFFLTAAQNKAGGAKAFYEYEGKVEIDPFSLVGQSIKGSLISDADARVMYEIWKGPHRENDEQLWYWFRPGVLCWNVIIPISSFYYNLVGTPKPFIIVTDYARWITKIPKQRFDNITMEKFVELFDKSIMEFADAAADKVNLAPFYQNGGKLIIDHGIDDPLIPVDGTINYYERLCAVMGGKDVVNNFCRLYITPGDGHGSCNWHGPGITESDGMTALIDWVEQNTPPGSLRVVQTGKHGNIICENKRCYY